MTTVVEHVLSRPCDIGIEHAFGVLGDFTFSPTDALIAERGLLGLQ